MIYKIISKAEFKRFIDALVKNNSSFGPRQVDTDSRGEAVYQFQPVSSVDEIAFDYTRTASSAKHFFLPFREELSRFHFHDGDWDQQVSYESNPVVLVGLRACDISALNILDDVLLNGHFPSAYYLGKTEEHLCDRHGPSPSAGLFLQVDEPSHGTDRIQPLLFRYRREYYLSINSSKAFNFLKEFETARPALRRKLHAGGTTQTHQQQFSNGN